MATAKNTVAKTVHIAEPNWVLPCRLLGNAARANKASVCKQRVKKTPSTLQRNFTQMSPL